ncbi:MAG: M23 family metallopeptidase [Actinomycetes bacterium]
MMRRTSMLCALVTGMGFIFLSAPAQAAPNYFFPISGCKVVYGRYHHNYPATDILTQKGCKFVAPFSGIVDEVNRVDRFTWKTNLGADRGGLSISVVGDDGVRYYGSHLSKIPTTMVPGVRVSAGEVIGYVGNSGDAKGLATHLHFGISWPTPKGTWWVRRGELYPWKFLDAWRLGKDLSPANSVATLEKKIGTVPKIPSY